MKRYVTLFYLTLFLTTVASAGTPVEPKTVSETTGDYTAGRLFFPELEFDFGYVPQNGSVSHSFWLLNKGTDTLEIIQVKPG